MSKRRWTENGSSEGRHIIDRPEKALWCPIRCPIMSQTAVRIFPLRQNGQSGKKGGRSEGERERRNGGGEELYCTMYDGLPDAAL